MSDEKPAAVPTADQLRMAILSKEMADMEKRDKLRAQKEEQLAAEEAAAAAAAEGDPGDHEEPLEMPGDSA